MHVLRMLRRTALLVAIVALVAGCAAPQENGPTDLNEDADHNGIADTDERNMTNATGGGSNATSGVTPGDNVGP
ncbi:MAG TPA: hypothetical protein VM370_00650 [Candidatus Thermoplasmatota archaeon]|nr:hypothetical protein [Candidatus Thermoplasmatota archaeon]